MSKYWTERFYCRVFMYYRLQKAFYSSNYNIDKSYYFAKILGTSQNTAQYLYTKYPVISKLSYEDLNSLIDTVTSLGIKKEYLLKIPTLFSLAPITLRHRFRILQECGFHEITGSHVAYCLKIIKNMTIKDVKTSGYIMSTINVPNKLASYMSQWPSLLTTLIQSDINNLTLYILRLTILQRYLQLTLNVNDIEFNRGLITYPTIKLRPLQMIHESITLLQEVIGIPNSKIKSNLFLVSANSENLNDIVYNVRNLAGVDIKEILRMYPKLCMVHYSNFIQIKNIMEEFGIDNEAQIRCFNIFTLAPKTIRKRLEKAKDQPEFQLYLRHPRFLKIIMYYDTRATQRMLHMYKTNRQCLSLNLLSGSTKNFQKIVKSPGDHIKGKDLLYYISQELGNQYSISDIRQKIKIHPFWVNIPLVQVRLVYKLISNKFSSKEIFDNCAILLYPVNKIMETLTLIRSNNSELHQQLPYLEQVNIKKINNSQELSLTLYVLEKKNNFNGNGVWGDDKLIPKYREICETNQ